MQRDHKIQQRARCNLWDRLVLRARDLCLAMRLPGRSASRLVWPTLSATSNRTPSKASTTFIHAGNNSVMLLFASFCCVTLEISCSSKYCTSCLFYTLNCLLCANIVSNTAALPEEGKFINLETCQAVTHLALVPDSIL